MRKFLVGSDWWTDCDDAVAMRLLARAHLRGEIEILGIGINACMSYSVESICAFFHFEGIDNLRIGIDKEATDFGGNPPYQKRLANSYNSPQNNENASDAKSLYLDILQNSKEKIEIIEIGYPQVLAEVLKSDKKLFESKVSKVWMMAGKWDEQGGKENNFKRNERSRKAAEYFCKNCPVPITFLGFEVGESVLVGGNLDKDDQLYKAMHDMGCENGRSAWDPMLVLTAIIGDESEAEYDMVFGTASVDSSDGANYFKKDEKGKHSYLVKKQPDEYYKDLINSLIK